MCAPDRGAVHLRWHRVGQPGGDWTVPRPRRRRPPPPPNPGPATEHHAVLDAVEHLAATAGAEIDWLEVDDDCRLLPESFAAAVGRDTGRGSGCGSANIALATVMWANNEVGAESDIAAIAAIAHAAGIPLHTDAVQAAPILGVNFAGSGAAAHEAPARDCPTTQA